MKKQSLFYFVLLCMMASCMMLACESTVDNPQDETKQEEQTTTGKTYVRFNNRNEFAVTIYSDSSRAQATKIADVGANAMSGEIETYPNAYGTSYFPTYSILIEGIPIPYRASSVVSRIDENKTNEVPVPLISTLEAGELTKSLTENVYVKVVNDSSFSLTLRQGNTEKIPEGMASPVLNSNETGIYTMQAALASTFSFRKNGTVVINFPDGFEEFVGGHIYFFRYDGGDLVLLVDKPATIAQALILQAPENVNIQALASGNISLTWERAGTETSYRIYRAPSGDETFNQIGSTESTSYTDSNVSVGSTYYYRVSACKNNLESDKSNTIVFATSNVSSLTPPSWLAVTAQAETSISLSWSAVSDASSYKIYKGASQGSVNEYVTLTYSTSYTVSGLSPGTGYYFCVSAIDANAESAKSEAVYGQTSQSASNPGDGGTITPPPVKPEGLVVTQAASYSISLSWNSSQGAASYNIYRANSQTGASAKIGSATETSYTDSSVPEGRQFFYSIVGVNTSGNSPASDVASAFSVSHYSLQNYGSAYVMSISAGAYHYYRLRVYKNQQYTIVWENGSAGDSDYYYTRAAAWQSNGTSIFSNAANGYTSPKVITASSDGYVTVEISNTHSSNSYNYKVYCY
jgi:fibronectin type 3 domain-containing protein